MYGAQSIQATSVRIVLALSSIFGFKVRSTEVNISHFQSETAIKCAIYIKNLAQELELEPNECLQLLNLLYGLSYSCDHWHKTLNDHI